MGQAFDGDGRLMGEAFGETKRDVFDKLTAAHGDAAEIRIRSLQDRETNGGADMEMPRYKCHKDVWALKIERIQLDADTARVDGRETDGSARLFVEAPYAPIRVDGAFVRKHTPVAGGYYVVYKDGYKSFSPADAFTDGYTRI